MQFQHLYYFFETKLNQFYRYLKNRYFEYSIEYNGIKIERIYCWNLDNFQERILLKDFPTYFPLRKSTTLLLKENYENNLYEIHYYYGDKTYVFLTRNHSVSMPPFHINSNNKKIGSLSSKTLLKGTATHLQFDENETKLIQTDFTKYFKNYEGPFQPFNIDIQYYAKIWHHLIFIYPDDPIKMFSIHFDSNMDTISDEEKNIYQENQLETEGTITLTFFDKTEYIYDHE